LHDKVISGGLPEGDEAFQELERLGVKTVISVDGAKPDVAIAKKYGMRYVHLPHGYDGIPDARVQDLAKAVHDLPGPIYIHCHHGKHRSPAAAAVACVATGLLDAADALRVLKAAGTSKNYRGLYQSAESARRIDEAKLSALKADFPETAHLPPMAEAMVAIEHTHDHLKSIAAANWKSPPSHPDLDPAHEALLLREHFTELLRTDSTKREPPQFAELAKQGESAATELEALLRQPVASPKEATKALEKVTQNCTTCHQAFRDIPLREKSAR
jgi:protein tyrosine phosphatase (PTP) superfamily phosphohydrolase (DUF442 family)